VTTDYNGAYDLITAELQTYWAANAPAIVTPAPAIRFYGNEQGAVPATYFIRFVMAPVTDRQSSFRQTDGKRFRADGLISIQVFGPRKDRMSYEKTRQLSALLQKRFRNAIDCISFNNVRINDKPPLDAYWQQNVIAEYWYDEIQAAG
jgi:hypothetical protein